MDGSHFLAAVVTAAYDDYGSQKVSLVLCKLSKSFSRSRYKPRGDHGLHLARSREKPTIKW